MLPIADEVDPTEPPPTPAESGKRFAYLVAGLVVIALLAENFKHIRALPAKVTQDKKQVVAWALFLSLLYSGYVYQPESDDPSVVITFGAGVQLFTFVLLWVMPRKKAAYYLQPSGDSPEFALLMTTGLCLRLLSTCRYQGYLPTDATGDGCYQALEGLAMLIAIRGLMETGITPAQGMRSVATVLGCICFALVCYGDLDRRPVWDRVYAASIYIEVVSWAFIGTSLFRAGPERTIKPSFLVPAIVHATLRAVFWYIAQDEMNPKNPIRLMAYFPMAIVGLHFMLASSLLVLGLVILCAPEETIPSSMVDANKVSPVDYKKGGAKGEEPLLGMLASALSSAGNSASNLVPVRAVFEDGTLRVEYAATAGKEALE